ncbi:MAG: HypC/HybG/HupF family hydrogenase formation chaperone [Candidatus Omnitrophota bacterium]
MCIAIPMKVVDIKGETGTVEIQGVRRDVGLQLVENINVNDWVIVHTGFAISKLEEEDALETIKLMKEGGIIG